MASQPCKLAGTRSMVELLGAWMFIAVSLFLFCAMESFSRLYGGGGQASRLAGKY
jgi:hypothetical protein